MLTRREFSKVFLATGTATLASESAWPVSAPLASEEQSKNQLCDLLIKGGTVIDPGQHLHARLDVAVDNGKIFEVASDIPESRGRQVFSAKDKIVTPGFIDLHVHCFDGVQGGVNADHYFMGRGVTAAVDAGSTGYPMINAFVKYVVNNAVTRIRALVHIGAMGITVGISHSMDDLNRVNPQLTAKAAEENKPAVVGIKIHLNRDIYNRPEEMELVLLKRALEAAETSHLPLMIHIVSPYQPLPEILKIMRKGDVFTHCFNGFPHGILDANGKILPEVREARQRGIIFDVAEGLRGLSFDVAEKSFQQDFLPDSISTDLNKAVKGYEFNGLPDPVSKFVALGMDLDKAIERVTVRPSQVFDFGTAVGTLQPGNEANIGIFELRDGNFEFADSNGVKRIGHQRLVNKATVCRGQLFGNDV